MPLPSSPPSTCRSRPTSRIATRTNLPGWLRPSSSDSKQVWPDARSRIWSGNEIYGIDHAAERVAAAAEVAHGGPVQLVLTGRAENHIHGVQDLADTIVRLQRYQEAGADVLFAPGVTDLADLRLLISEVDRPVNVVAAPRLSTSGRAGRSRCATSLCRIVVHLRRVRRPRRGGVRTPRPRDVRLPRQSRHRLPDSSSGLRRGLITHPRTLDDTGAQGLDFAEVEHDDRRLGTYRK